MGATGRPEKPLSSSGPLLELANELRRLRGREGLTLQELAARTGLAISTLNTAAAGRRPPSWRVTQAFAAACGADVRQVRELWERACAAAGRTVPDDDQPMAGDPPDPARAQDAAGFVRELRRLRAWAGSPSLATLNASTGGYHLPPSTVSQALRRDRLPPRRDLVTAYVRACLRARELDDEDLVARWERAWEVLKARQERAAAAPPPPRAEPPAADDVPPRAAVHWPPPKPLPLIEFDDVTLHTGSGMALDAVSMTITKGITALMGPYGSGTDLLLRALHPGKGASHGIRIEGRILFHGQDLHARDTASDELRRRIVMAAERPELSARSIHRNVIADLPDARSRRRSRRAALDDACERALKRADLWDAVKHRLRRPAHSLSPGQRLRLSIARALTLQPEVLLLDQPFAMLDPFAMTEAEDLIIYLARDTTIVFASHSMPQIARLSDHVAFFTAVRNGPDHVHGRLIEYDTTPMIFTNPRDKLTENYITGRFG